MRFINITTHAYVMAPGGENENYFTEQKGYEMWRDGETGGFWVKKGGLCKWLGPTTVKDGTPHPDDIPQSPKEFASKEAKKKLAKAPTTDPAA